jgi:hypothetical protein
MPCTLQMHMPCTLQMHCTCPLFFGDYPEVCSALLPAGMQQFVLTSHAETQMHMHATAIYE